MGSKKLGFLGACSACALLSCSDIRAMHYNFAEMSERIGGISLSPVTSETPVSLQNQNQTLQNQLQQAQNNLAQLQNQFQAAQHNSTKLQNQNQALGNDLVKEKNTSAKLQNQLQALGNDLVKEKNTSAKLQNQNQALGNDLVKEKNTSANLQNQLQALQNQNQALGNDLVKEKNTSANLQNQLQTEQNNLAQLQNDFVNLQSQLSDKNEQYSELNAKFEELNNQNQDLQEKLRRIGTLDVQIKYREGLIQSSEKQYNDVLNETEDARNALKILEKQVDEKEEDLNRLEKEIESQKANKDEIRREIMLMSQYNIGDLESELKRVKKDIAELRSKIQRDSNTNKKSGKILIDKNKLQNLEGKETALETLIEQYDTFRDADNILHNRKYDKLSKLEFKEKDIEALMGLLRKDLSDEDKRRLVNAFVDSLKKGYNRRELSEFFRLVIRIEGIESEDAFDLILNKDNETPLFYANVLLRASRSLENKFWSHMFDMYLAYMFQALSKEQQ